jgi:predicted transcriptional regulator
MIQIPDTLVHELLTNPELKKSDTRTVIFLLQRPGALSSNELSKGIGVSKRAATKSINRLIGAGVVQPGEYQAKRRTLNILEMEQMEPKEVTCGSVEESLKTLAEKVDHLQTMIESLTGALEAVTSHDVQNMTSTMPVCVQVEEQKNTQAGMMQGSGQKRTGLNPAPVDAENVTEIGHIQTTTNHDGITDMIQAMNMTGTVTIQTIEDPSEPIQSIMSPVNDIERTKTLWVIAEQDAKGTTKDTINDDLDTALIRARGLLAAKQASLLKEKQQQKQPGAHASIGDEFKALFGVQLPSGSDQAAAAVMIARKKAGKLDNVKSPMGYLNSLAGKVQPIVTIPTPPPASNNPLPVNETTLNDYEQRRRIKAAWFGLDAEQRIPFHELREKKAMSGVPGRKVPVELLAFQQFTQECLAGRVQI